MFSAIKVKIILVLAGLLAIAGMLVKFLYWRNEKKDETIDALEQNAEVVGQVHEADIKRLRFEVKQKQRVVPVNDESELDKLDSEREKRYDKDYEDDNNWSSITR